MRCSSGQLALQVQIFLISQLKLSGDLLLSFYLFNDYLALFGILSRLRMQLIRALTPEWEAAFVTAFLKWSPAAALTALVIVIRA